MQITSLPATTNLSANDVLAVEVNGITYKITASTLSGILQGLAGTLPIAQGGTGMTSSPSLQVNLASSSAANVLQASPRPGVTGILALANGGLGTSDPAQARTALGVPGVVSFNVADWSDIKAKLESVPVNSSAAYFCTTDTTGMLTNNALSSSLKGTFYRIGTNTYDFCGIVGSGNLNGGFITWRVSGVTTSGATIGDIGTYISTNSTNGASPARTSLETAYAKYFAPPAGTSFTFTIPSGARTLFLLGDSNISYNAIFFVVSSSAGTVNVAEVFPGSFTYDKTVANKLTFNRSASGNNNILIISLRNTESSMPSLDS